MSKYIKKPIVVEAMQYTGDNVGQIAAFMNKKGLTVRGNMIFIDTLEGQMVVKPNAYIIKGVSGEFYPCKEEIFNRTYELVEERQNVVCDECVNCQYFWADVLDCSPFCAGRSFPCNNFLEVDKDD
jgi:hypothetical protein